MGFISWFGLVVWDRKKFEERKALTNIYPLEQGKVVLTKMCRPFTLTLSLLPIAASSKKRGPGARLRFYWSFPTLFEAREAHCGRAGVLFLPAENSTECRMRGNDGVCAAAMSGTMRFGMSVLLRKTPLAATQAFSLRTQAPPIFLERPTRSYVSALSEIDAQVPRQESQTCRVCCGADEPSEIEKVKHPIPTMVHIVRQRQSAG